MDIDKGNLKFIWLIDGRNVVSTVVIGKIKKLIGQGTLEILLDKRQKERERNFWLIDQIKLQTTWQQLDAEFESKVRSLEDALTEANIDHNLHLVSKKDLLATIDTLKKEHKANTLILQDESPETRHPIFQMFANLTIDVLLLTKNKWQPKPHLLGCVDPLHEHARPAELDDNVVIRSRNLAAQLNAKWTIAHAYFTPPMFLNYRQQFKEIHADGLMEFGKNHSLKKECLVLLNGLPETAITNWLVNHKADILVLGIVARNNLVSRFIGSTTMALLQKPPADMFLITGN